jgi:hypothetical protein
MPPVSRPYPRFVADAAQEKQPYGRWAERLADEFAKACEPYAEEAGASLDPESIKWFPERGYGGRVYVPATGQGRGDGEEPIEYFGHVSFVRPSEGDPTDVAASADFTDISAEDNPDWQVDLNDDVIAPWRAEGGRGGDVTLIWGLPLVRGAVAATAELDEEVVDQAAVEDGRFTLVAIDAVHGFGDDMYLEIVLWDRTLRRALATESLYADADADEEDEDLEDADTGAADAAEVKR